MKKYYLTIASLFILTGCSSQQPYPKYQDYNQPNNKPIPYYDPQDIHRSGNEPLTHQGKKRKELGQKVDKLKRDVSELEQTMDQLEKVEGSNSSSGAHSRYRGRASSYYTDIVR